MTDIINRKHKGAKNELTACVWLLDQGYEVFRNISPFGAIDLIATKDGAAVRIDVKAAYYGLDGREILSRLTQEQTAAGIVALHVFQDKCTIEWTPRENEERSCNGCGSRFSPATRNHFYCSQDCYPSPYVKKGRSLKRGRYKKSVHLIA